MMPRVNPLVTIVVEGLAPVTMTGRAAMMAVLLAAENERINAASYGKVTFHFGDGTVTADLLDQLGRRHAD